MKITDSVAVLNDKYSNDVRMGQVGTIVEVFGRDNNIFEVEFCDEGKTVATCVMQQEDLLKLYFK